ncbi:METK2 synthase, partial [Dicrurus megarhynchus]|nr:METK2 synthase [Dicrurus megarhynchus]
PGPGAEPLGRTEKARSGRGRGKYPPEPSAWSFPGAGSEPGALGAAGEAPTAPRGGEEAEASLRNPRPGREGAKAGRRGRLTESGIVYSRDLDLKKPLYQRTAAYGHFGRDSFPWEVPKKLKY